MAKYRTFTGHCGYCGQWLFPEQVTCPTTQSELCHVIKKEAAGTWLQTLDWSSEKHEIWDEIAS